MKYFSIMAVLMFITLVGCASGDNSVFPSTTDTTIRTNSYPAGQSALQPMLWGLYELEFDFENQEVFVSTNRSAMFSLNVTGFLNNNPLGVTVKINDLDAGGEFIDADVEVILTHPIPDSPQYDGYDVRGIFIGNGSGEMNYDPDLLYGVTDVDQIVMNSAGFHQRM